MSVPVEGGDHDAHPQAAPSPATTPRHRQSVTQEFAEGASSWRLTARQYSSYSQGQTLRPAPRWKRVGLPYHVYELQPSLRTAERSVRGPQKPFAADPVPANRTSWSRNLLRRVAIGEAVGGAKSRRRLDRSYGHKERGQYDEFVTTSDTGGGWKPSPHQYSHATTRRSTGIHKVVNTNRCTITGTTPSPSGEDRIVPMTASGRKQALTPTTPMARWNDPGRQSCQGRVGSRNYQALLDYRLNQYDIRGHRATEHDASAGGPNRRPVAPRMARWDTLPPSVELRQAQSTARSEAPRRHRTNQREELTSCSIARRGQHRRGTYTQ